MNMFEGDDGRRRIRHKERKINPDSQLSSGIQLGVRQHYGSTQCLGGAAVIKVEGFLFPHRPDGLSQAQVQTARLNQEYNLPSVDDASLVDLTHQNMLGGTSFQTVFIPDEMQYSDSPVGEVNRTHGLNDADLQII